MAELTIEGIKTVIDKAIADQITPILDTTLAKVNAIETKVNAMGFRVNAMAVRERNSHAGRDDEIEWPPREDTGVPHDPKEPFSINCLLVAGNEFLPNNQKKTWNKEKSMQALRYYGEGHESDSDSENEYSQKSRACRLRLAGMLGISRVQLNFAQMAL